MTTRRLTQVNVVFIIVMAVPIVWMLGYQDHPWRNGVLATFAGLLLVGASVALMSPRLAGDPPVPLYLRVAAIYVSSFAVLCALFWAWMG